MLMLKKKRTQKLFGTIFTELMLSKHLVSRNIEWATVRISKYKSILDKGYLPNFTEEVSKIKQVIFTKPIVYKLEVYQSEAVDGYFYEEE
jgi:hypothetical protein